MSSQRLRNRTPSARFVGVARLPRHVRRWHKKGRDGSGKCDVVYTGDPSDAVWGVLFAIEDSEKPALDRDEDLGIGYLTKTVRVLASNGALCAFTYHAKPGQTDPALRPTAWYKAHVARGAREHSLPAEVLREIDQVDVRPNGD